MQGVTLVIQRRRAFALVAALALSLGTLAQATHAEDLQLDSVDATEIGEMVSFSLLVIDAPSHIQSLGVDITFDESVMQFIGYESGLLVDRWPLFDVSSPQPGRLRIGGVAPAGGIDVGASGELAVLEFQIVGRFGTAVNLVDAVAGARLLTLGNGALHGVDPENLTLRLPQSTTLGANITVDVMINDPAKPVDAFGFDVTFDSGALSFIRISRGDLPEQWSHFDGSAPQDGRVRVGGYSAAGVWPAGQTARVASLEFEAIDDRSTALLLQNLVADMGSWTVSNGTINVRADADRDGMPDDFELAFNLDPEDPNDADSDADGDGLSNLAEFESGTDPTRSDTDGDGISDGEELAGGYDPLDSGDCPPNACSRLSKLVLILKRVQ